jgi:hypothetical protein
LYLTEPNNKKLISDCWIYNRIEAPKYEEIEKYRLSPPPPASVEYVGNNSLVTAIDEKNIKIVWSINGENVVLLIEGLPFGYILSEHKRGFSVNLIKNCSWGNVFDNNIYNKLFK